MDSFVNDDVILFAKTAMNKALPQILEKVVLYDTVNILQHICKHFLKNKKRKICKYHIYKRAFYANASKCMAFLRDLLFEKRVWPYAYNLTRFCKKYMMINPEIGSHDFIFFHKEAIELEIEFVPGVFEKQLQNADEMLVALVTNGCLTTYNWVSYHRKDLFTNWEMLDKIAKKYQFNSVTDYPDIYTLTAGLANHQENLIQSISVGQDVCYIIQSLLSISPLPIHTIVEIIKRRPSWRVIESILSMEYQLIFHKLYLCKILNVNQMWNTKNIEIYEYFIEHLQCSPLDTFTFLTQSGWSYEGDLFDFLLMDGDPQFFTLVCKTFPSYLRSKKISRTFGDKLISSGNITMVKYVIKLRIPFHYHFITNQQHNIVSFLMLQAQRKVVKKSNILPYVLLKLVKQFIPFFTFDEMELYFAQP